jgi:N utilization substance protein B
MALSQQKFREMVFQLLYSYDIGHPDEIVMLDLIMGELAVSKKNVRLAQERMHRILEKLPEIDPLIASASISYDFNRIQTVTKNILRLGTFELFFDQEIPYKVAIAEAMRLARKFGTPESASFVNALLDYLYRTSLGDQTSPKALEHKGQDLKQSEELAQQVALEIEKAKKEEKEIELE